MQLIRLLKETELKIKMIYLFYVQNKFGSISLAFGLVLSRTRVPLPLRNRLPRENGVL